MARLTIRKHGRKAPVEDNTPQSSNAGKRVAGKNNRVSKLPIKRNKHANTVVEEEVEEDDEDDEPAPPRVKDVSQETYTLHKSVIVAETPIVGDTDFLKLAEFNYIEFETHNIRNCTMLLRKVDSSLRLIVLRQRYLPKVLGSWTTSLLPLKMLQIGKR